MLIGAECNVIEALALAEFEWTDLVHDKAVHVLREVFGEDKSLAVKPISHPGKRIGKRGITRKGDGGFEMVSMEGCKIMTAFTSCFEIRRRDPSAHREPVSKERLHLREDVRGFSGINVTTQDDVPWLLDEFDQGRQRGISVQEPSGPECEDEADACGQGAHAWSCREETRGCEVFTRTDRKDREWSGKS